MSKLSIHQLPKSPGFLQCLGAFPGEVLLNADINSLEPRVLAQASKDRKLMSLYGPGAKPGDIYLVAGEDIPGYGDQIRQYYDPENPTAEGVALAKKELKALRKILKIVFLSFSYGAGPRRIHNTLTLAGEVITLDEVTTIWRGMRDGFSGVQEFENRLRAEWRRNKGYILNAFGLPMCIPYEKLKDCKNRYIQSSGHMVLMKFLNRLESALNEYRVTWYPWIIDLHDEYTISIKESDSELGLAAHHTALAQLNEELGWEVQMVAEPQIATNLAAIKIED